MTWRDRLQENIRLTGPDGSVFTPNWTDDERTLERKLGVFDFPGSNGAEIQDQGSRAAVWPIDLIFEGENNDLEASRFFKAAAVSGLWSIAHPVKGAVSVYLASITERNDPTGSGNITRISTEWIEPKDTSAAISLPELKGRTFGGVSTLQATNALQFVDNARQTTSRGRVAIVTATNRAKTAITETLGALYASDSSLLSQVNAILRGIDNTLDEIPIDVEVLAGQVNNVTQLPALANTDSASRTAAYSAFIDEVLDIDVSGTLEAQKNTAGVQELSATAAIGALSTIAVTSELSTRPQALGLIEDIKTKVQEVTDALDTIQSDFAGVDIDQQYFSQSQSFNDAYKVTAAGIAYLLSSSFNLLVEKTIILSIPTAPIMLSIQEYGPENIEANLDLFISSNDLKGDDILLMPAGKSVVVYV